MLSTQETGTQVRHDDVFESEILLKKSIFAFLLRCFIHQKYLHVFNKKKNLFLLSSNKFMLSCTLRLVVAVGGWRKSDYFGTTTRNMNKLRCQKLYAAINIRAYSSIILVAQQNLSLVISHLQASLRNLFLL